MIELVLFAGRILLVVVLYVFLFAVMRTGVGGNVLYDVARATQHKDRYSALAMAVRYIAELEDERKRRLMRPRDAAIGVVSKF